ncbi:neurogenic locus notch homolog protein 2-like [Saccostrea cucullata]|uniref:neurogenic locus notch homolog protein 2-like n=1 Tax=Saccostrea cuccullata TaxID=36930 RepID=UPI002ED02C2C
MQMSLLRKFLLVGGIILHWQNILAQSVGGCNNDSDCIENANCDVDSNQCFCDMNSAPFQNVPSESIVCQVGACSLVEREDECGPRGKCKIPEDIFDYPVCFCHGGFFGPRCMDLCERNSDCNEGTCVEKGGQKVCDCPPGTTGSQCQVRTTTVTTPMTTTRRSRLGGVVLAVGGGIGLLALLGVAAATSAVSG